MHNSQVVDDDDDSEVSFRRWLARRWGSAWHEYVEPTAGSTMGAPDMRVLPPGQDYPVPVELKIAKLVGRMIAGQRYGSWSPDLDLQQERIKPRDLRPAQILWHDNLARAGGRSCLLLGVLQPAGGFHGYVQPRCYHAILRQWRRGFPVKDLTLVATNDGIDFEVWERCMALG